VSEKKEEKPAVAGFDLQEWLAKRYVDDVLPSGLKVKLRKVSLMDLATEGGIPEPLVAMISGKAKKIELAGDQLAEVMQVFEATARACIVEPEVIDGYSADGKLGVKDLPYTDKEFIFNKANEGVMSLANFREEGGKSKKD
jgi:hypothetical protein